MSAGRVVLLVAGIVVALLALVALASGALVLVENHNSRDSAGYFSTGEDRYRTSGYALASDELDLGRVGPNWLFEEGRLGSLRLRGTSRADEAVFIGIGPSDDVELYLAGVHHAVVTDLDFDPFRVEARNVPGRSMPPRPDGRAFWAVSASGPGRQTVEWDFAKGDWTAVVMNADGSPGVDVRLSVGAKSGWIVWIGLGLLVVGLLLLAGGVAMIVRSLRGRAASA